VSRRVRLLVFAAGAFIFAILIRQAGLGGLLNALHRTGWVLLPIIGVWGVTYLTNTFAWEQLIRASASGAAARGRPTIPFLRAYAISVASFAINYVTPFVALGGEPFRIASAAQWIGTARAAGSVVSFRVAHSLGQVIFWIIAVPVAFVVLPHTPATAIVLAVAAILLLATAAILLSLFRRGFVVRVLDTLPRLPILRRFAPRLERARATLEHIDSQMTVLTEADGERSRLIAAVVAEVAGRCVAMLEFLFIARAMGLHIGYPTAFVIGAFSQLVIVLTIFLPFELGSREGGLYLIYQLLGLPPALGVYTAVVTRLRELIWIAIGLTFVWVSGRRGGRRAGRGASRRERRPATT
jgi:uncharacterized protein (TIRG00374 family)